MAQLERITIYPIKSLDGYDVANAELISGAGLRHDRQFALRGADGEFFSAKRTEKIHRLRSVCDPLARTLELRRQGENESARFHLDDDRAAIEAWLGEYFGARIMLVEHDLGGFPDDNDSPGPTIVSGASIEAVSQWMPELSPEDLHRRFRMNLVVSGVEPFWEDRLFGSGDGVVRFQIGDVTFEGTNPCQRCPVPTRNPETGEEYEHFVVTLARQRAATLPDWAPKDRFDHTYRFTTNTRLVPTGRTGKIHVGDQVSVVG
ncbi:MAG: MOSC domain-containing protein [Pirellulales bacterium]|nr:MOSC domain-containing protein [Pirellulales bacterium]